VGFVTGAVLEGCGDTVGLLLEGCGDMVGVLVEGCGDTVGLLLEGCGDTDGKSLAIETRSWPLGFGEMLGDSVVRIATGLGLGEVVGDVIAGTGEILVDGLVVAKLNVAVAESSPSGCDERRNTRQTKILRICLSIIFKYIFVSLEYRLAPHSLLVIR